MSFDRFTYPCVAVDARTDVWVEKIIKVLVEVFVIAVRDDVVIDTVTIDIVSGIGVEVLADVTTNISGAVMIDLVFVLSAA